MKTERVIAAVEPLLQVAIKHARCVGADEIRIPIGRAISVMHELQHLRDTIRREAKQTAPSEAFNRVKWA